MDTCPKGYMASGYIGHKAVSRGPLRGQLGSCIYLFVLYNISMGWTPTNLKVDALRIQGTHRLPGLVHQGTDTVEALERLKSGLGVRDDNNTVESSKG